MINQKPNVLLLLETKVINEAANQACAAIKLPKVHRIDGNEFKGGIWLFWDPDKVKVVIVHATDQAVHAIIQVQTRPTPFSFFRRLCISY